MILIKNGAVHDGRGGEYLADVLIDGGKIARVAPNIEAAGAETVDASGKYILPGFVDSLNCWGVSGPGWGEGDCEETCEPSTPEMNIVYGFDHDGMNFQKLYTYGVTAAGIGPRASNVIGGQAAVFKTYGRGPYRMLVKESAAMVASVNDMPKKLYGGRNTAPMTRMGAFSILIEALKKAQRHGEKDGYDAKAEALKKVLSGEMPLFIACTTRAQSEGVLAAMRQFEGVRVVLSGAYDLTSVAEEIASGRMAAVTADSTEAFNRFCGNAPYADTVALMEAGAKIAISCSGDMPSMGRENLLWNAILWHKRGLSSKRTLAGITSVPAELLGVSDRIGAIAEGMDADLCIWSGDPIETYAAKVEAAYINGENILDKEAYASCW